MLEKYYLTIEELPLFNWFKCCDNELIYARRDKHKGTVEDDLKAWEIIYNDFINKIGLDPKFIGYLDLLEERAKRCLEFIQSLNEGKRNRFLINEVNRLNLEIKSFEERGTKKATSKTSILNSLSKMQGYRINPKETTTIEYFTLIKDYGEAN